MAKKYLGIDIGGTKILGALSERGRICWKKKCKTPKTNRTAFLNIIDEIISESAPADGVGLGVPSPLSLKGGKLEPPNLPCIRGFDLKKYVEKKHKLAVRIENDANCFALGEYLYGAGRGSKNFVGLTIGTGIGGGWILDGRLYRGFAGSAMEVGHMVIDGENSFEELSAAKFLRKMSSHDPLEMMEMAASDDREILKIYAELGKNLGKGIANIINVLNPEIIALGGGLARAAQFFLDAAKKEALKFVVSSQAKKTKIVLAKLGDEAGAVGAASLFGIG